MSPIAWLVLGQCEIFSTLQKRTSLWLCEFKLNGAFTVGFLDMKKSPNRADLNAQEYK